MTLFSTIKMRRYISIVFYSCIILFFGCNNIVKEFYVATNGNDGNPGTESRPFATLGQARNAIRQIQKEDTIRIIIREGTYYLSNPLLLKPIDSGTSLGPVIWKAAENEQVTISGGKVIDSSWKTDDGKTWFTQLSKDQDTSWVFRQLFVDGKRITRARFPNRTKQNPFLYALSGTDSSLRIDKNFIKESWGQSQDAQINIVPNWKFFNQWNTVKSVDTEKGEIHLKNEELHTKIIKGNWFWIEGVKEELDEPEEWFLDNASRVLYYMPQAGLDPNNQAIIAPYLNRLIDIQGDVEMKTHVKHVQFRDLELKHTTFSLGHIEPRVHTDATIMLQNATNCVIENCRFENIGGFALWLHLDSKENVFNNNTVTESGAGGVLMTGARLSYMDKKRLLTPGKEAAKVFPILNQITNNTVKHCGKIRYYGGGVHLDSRPANMAMSTGNYIAHNHFFDLSRNGIFAFRNQGGNVVEYNLIHDVMKTTIDGACIHFGTMTHLNAPNYIMNNYLFDIWGYEQMPNDKPVRHLANGIFLDWATSNTTVKENYIYNSGGNPIKPIMGNWNLKIQDNMVSQFKIIPPFIEELGPGKTATNGIDMESNHLIGNVIHYSDIEYADYKGSWRPREIIGFWDLFSFNILEAPQDQFAEISYNLPIEKDGIYQVSIMYLPSKNNASNATIQIHHSEGSSVKEWDMQTGDKFGFALELGQYYFKKDGAAKVTISNQGADGIVVANSVAFVLVENN